MANSDAENAFMVNALTAGNMYGPNPFSQYTGRFPMPGYAGAAIDALGQGIAQPARGQQGYLSFLADPGAGGKGYTMPGAQAPTGAQPMSVLDTYLNNASPGVGAGGMYTNKPFFDTLNAMKAAPGGTGSGGTANNAPIYQNAPVAVEPPATTAAAAPTAATAAVAPAANPYNPTSGNYYGALGSGGASQAQRTAADRSVLSAAFANPTMGKTLTSMGPQTSMPQYGLGQTSMAQLMAALGYPPGGGLPNQGQT